MAASGVLLAACGGMGGDEVAGGPDSDGINEAAGPGVGSVLEATSPTVAAGSANVSAVAAGDDGSAVAIDELERHWADRRQWVVAALTGGNFGLGLDNVLRGPGLFELDLEACPRGWDDRAGLTDSTITVALIGPQSGDQASFHDLAKGIDIYFGWVNASGGIDGRTIELVTVDDRYHPEIASQALDDILDGNEPFWVTSVGSPGALGVYGTLNNECVPQPFVASSHPAFGDPGEHPFTTGLELSYSTEALVWGEWIKQNLDTPKPLTVGALVIDNEFGQTYLDSFTIWAEANPDIVASVEVVRHHPATLTVAAEMAEIVAAEPDVFLSMTTGQPCLSAVRQASRLGLTQSAEVLFTPSVCRQPSSYLVPLGGEGDGFHVVGGGLKSVADPAYADESFVAFANERLMAAGSDPAQSLLGVGFAHYGWAHVEALRIASALPGGLSRSNLVLAMRNLDLAHPMALEGVRFATNGALDGFPIEGAQVSRYDAAAETWLAQGEPLDVNGSSPPCVWTHLACGRPGR